MSEAILYTVSLSITTASALHLNDSAVSSAVRFRGWHTQGQGNTAACKNSLKKKQQNALVLVDLRVQEKKYAGQKRYKIK